MKHHISLLFLMLPALLPAQRPVYDSLVLKANAAFGQQQYSLAAPLYLNAFKALGYRGFQDDRLNAAKALAMVAMPDSALDNLNRIKDFLEYEQVAEEPLFVSLKTHPMWEKLLAELRPEMPALADILKQIYDLDQQHRKKLKPTAAQYGYESPEYRNLWKEINFQDSLNQIQVFGLIDQYGWLGKKQVGNKASKTVFLVVQHSDLTAQERYLPLMRRAAAEGNAGKGDLAMLEDRILIRKGQKQRYATQKTTDYSTGETRFLDIEDIDNLNKRRAEMNLPAFTEETIASIKKAQQKQ